MSENIHFDKLAKFEIINIIVFGIILSGALFFYGAFALLQAECVFVGRGNAPIGTFVHFYGWQARLISSIYIGAGISIFSLTFLKRIAKSYKQASYVNLLTWLGVLLALFGFISLVAIMLSVFF